MRIPRTTRIGSRTRRRLRWCVRDPCVKDQRVGVLRVTVLRVTVLRVTVQRVVGGRDGLCGGVRVRLGTRGRRLGSRRERLGRRRCRCPGGYLRRDLSVRHDQRFRRDCGRVRYLGLGLGLDRGVSQRLGWGIRRQPVLGAGSGVPGGWGHFPRVGPGVGHVLRPSPGIRLSRSIGIHLRVQGTERMGRRKVVRQFVVLGGVVPARRPVRVSGVVPIGGTVGIGRVLVAAHDVAIPEPRRPDMCRPEPRRPDMCRPGMRRLARERRLGA